MFIYYIIIYINIFADTLCRMVTCHPWDPSLEFHGPPGSRSSVQVVVRRGPSTKDQPLGVMVKAVSDSVIPQGEG